MSNSSGYAGHMGETLTQKICRGPQGCNPFSKQVNEPSNKPTTTLCKKPSEPLGAILERKFTVYWLF